MSVFYIVVEDDEQKKVVTSSNGHPREFSKQKKARNFIDGRSYIQAKNPEIVTEIDEINHDFKVDI